MIETEWIAATVAVEQFGDDLVAEIDEEMICDVFYVVKLADLFVLLLKCWQSASTAVYVTDFVFVLLCCIALSVCVF